MIKKVKIFEDLPIEEEDLEYCINNGMPVIVDWFYGGIALNEAANGHSSIVVGIMEEHGYSSGNDCLSF